MNVVISNGERLSSVLGGLLGKGHYSELIYDEIEADRQADERMYAGAMHYDPPRVIVLEL